MKVVIIGAGINGLSVGVKLLEIHRNLSVTIISDKVTPDTAGDVSPGLWMPYAVCEDDHRFENWCRSTYSYLSDIVQTDPDHHKYGIYYQEMYDLSDNEPLQMKLFNQVVDVSRFMNERELKRFPVAKYGIASTTILSEGEKLLSYLNDKFIAGGGIIKHHLAESFDEVQEMEDFPIVINCSGLGSRELCNDLDVNPVRTQILRVDAPWVKSAVVMDHRFFILPQSNGVVVLGGTTQSNNWDSSPNDKDTEIILNGAMKLLPGLKNSKIISVKVGLRPRRSIVRLESENRTNSKTGKSYKLIHNYGQGESAFTLFWGCAEDVVKIVSEAISK